VYELSQFGVLADGLDHPECVCVGPDGVVYAGGEAGQIYRLSPDGAAEQIAETHGFVLGIAIDADSRLYACDLDRRAVLRISPGDTRRRWPCSGQAGPDAAAFPARTGWSSRWTRISHATSATTPAMTNPTPTSCCRRRRSW